MNSLRIVLAALISTSALMSYSQGKARISIRKEVNGQVTEETRTMDIQEGEDIETILQSMGVLDEFGQLKGGQQFEINIEKSVTGDPSQNIHFYYSPTAGQPAMPPMPPSPPMPPTPPMALMATQNEQMGNQAYLGVMLKNNSDEWLDPSLQGKKMGAIVTEIMDGTPAAEAKLQVGDVITQISGESMLNLESVIATIQSKKPGESVKIGIIRDDKKKTIKVKLGERPIDFFETQDIQQIDLNSPDGMGLLKNFNYQIRPDSIVIFSQGCSGQPGDTMCICQPFGWSGEGLELIDRAFLGITPGNSENEKGIVIGSIINASSAESMGLKAGDIIKSINGQPLNDFETLSQTIGSMNPGDKIEIVFERDGRTKSVSGSLGKRIASDKDGFRIFHDFKGMDENGDYLYNYEFDMDHEDIEQHMEEMLRNLDDQQMRIDEERDRLNSELDRIRENHEMVQITIVVDEITADEANGVNQNASPKLETSNTLTFDKIVFFPNPNEGVINLNFTSIEKGRMEVMIFDSLGAKVYLESNNTFNGFYTKTIDISTQPSGSYYLQISINGKTYSKKIVKG